MHTDFVTAAPILSVGIRSAEGNFGILPFYHVEIYQSTRKKSLLVNYTFGNEHGFKTPVGGLKLQLLQAIRPLFWPTYFIVPTGTLEEMKQCILQVLFDARDGERLLFVWERGAVDDRPFFQALQLIENKDNVTVVTLESLGLTIEKPFEICKELT